MNKVTRRLSLGHEFPDPAGIRPRLTHRVITGCECKKLFRLDTKVVRLPLTVELDMKVRTKYASLDSAELAQAAFRESDDRFRQLAEHVRDVF